MQHPHDLLALDRPAQVHSRQNSYHKRGGQPGCQTLIHKPLQLPLLVHAVSWAYKGLTAPPGALTHPSILSTTPLHALQTLAMAANSASLAICLLMLLAANAAEAKPWYYLKCPGRDMAR